MKLSDASIVLTGASGGIGSATAHALVAQGARVLLVGRSERAVLALARSACLPAASRTQVDALVVDVTTEAGRQAVCDAARARDANVLINNAGVQAFGALQAISAQTVEDAVHTNLLAPMLLTQALLPHLLGRPAVVMNIGSMTGSIGIPGFSAYGATKAGLRMFSEALRRELCKTSVKVLYLAPRAVETSFNSAHARAFNQATKTRADTPDAVAQAICQALIKETPEVFLGTQERVASTLNALLRCRFDAVFSKHAQVLPRLRPEV